MCFNAHTSFGCDAVPRTLPLSIYRMGSVTWLIRGAARKSPVAKAGPVRAGPGENRDPRGTCEIVAGAAFEEALVRTYLALIEPAMKEVKTRWIVSAS